jgi:sulfite exporter TauE/SafE
MTSREQGPQINPVLIVGLGVTFVALAILLLLNPSLGIGGISLDLGTGSFGQISVAFITGLTTGGLSCLAVQGGLLASSLAHQIEQDYMQSAPVAGKRRNKKINVPRPKTALPIALFLISKLVAYTLLGALLGLVGSFFTLSLVTRAILMIGIGVFMVGNGLRMLNIHPLFRYFSIEPPKFITRYIRRTAKNGTELFTPIFLGALTVFIPCGITQAMMAAALATGSPALGAAMMFAFILGTSPVFFLVAYLTTQIGARLEKFFMRFVAAVVLILGLVTLNGGLNLIGSPLSFNNLTQNLFSSLNPPASVNSNQASASTTGDVVLNVSNNGYFPRTLLVSANQPFTLNLRTQQTTSCSRDFVIPSLNYYQLLPQTGTVKLNIPAQPSGTKLFFTCSMGMYTGQIVFQ